jgi:signal transduction histidine kinase
MISFRRRWVILTAWCTWGLLTTAQVVVYSRLAGSKPVPLLIALRLQMPLAFLWALATPGIIRLGRRFPPFEGPRWPRGVAVNLLAAMVAVYVEVVVLIVNQRWVEGLPPNAPPLLLAGLRGWVWWLLADGLLYWAILVIDYQVEHYRTVREREVRASQIEARFAEVRLQALKTQLHPHFLFNALHTVGQLIRTGRDGMAVQVLGRLGDLLRRVLDTATTQEVPLKQELEFVNSYLDIEKVRFQDRLDVAVAADADTLDARVPHLILQSLVENAIRHGIAAHQSAGRVSIAARRVDSALHLSVRDDGPGLASGMVGEGSGLGLANTTARLRELYGDAASLEVVNAPDGGVVARVVLPFQLAPAEWAGSKEGTG